MLIRDGSSMPILAIRDSYIKQKKSTIPLNNVLLVSNLTKNLLSISQLTTQFLVNFKFYNVYFYKGTENRTSNDNKKMQGWISTFYPPL